MTHKRTILLALGLIVAVSVLAAATVFRDRVETQTDIIEILKKDLEMAECEDENRLESVRKLFKEKGASDTEIAVESFDSVENVVVTIKGGEETVVVGAHFDKVKFGCGVLDNWSGVVLVANLYSAVKKYPGKKTFKFVAFGKEEKGLVGSGKMAKAIPKDERVRYCAMVNFDSFGMYYPQVLNNVSDKKLTELTRQSAEELKIPYSDASIDWASSDSASFQRVDIPAITLHGLGRGFEQIIHSSKDKIEEVEINSLYHGYRMGLSLLGKIDAADCGAFR
ncbi:MAG: Zn-dependent exopeptidase M28 [Acidobacteria bacterium]|nr:MAG: Zn-dependent exopeptidase M28 [Acidobacteriota bacterium]REJ99282.1 MAG: Zn-dependent exopeptidase M28 [Acidobacteriota bacterium]REK15997.1 MAG: Zn-dependent exopeptidase M28 [Acidobacteriota bacterium]REK43678.1 MAG: Zn-dependent exopeptidase M28 [Acidobacteriota bacterium]